MIRHSLLIVRAASFVLAARSDAHVENRPVPCYWNLSGAWLVNSSAEGNKEAAARARVHISSQQDFFTASSPELWAGTATGAVGVGGHRVSMSGATGLVQAELDDGCSYLSILGYSGDGALRKHGVVGMCRAGVAQGCSPPPASNKTGPARPSPIPAPALPLRPYGWIGGEERTPLPGAAHSPDPLVNWTWAGGDTAAAAGLFLYNVTARNIEVLVHESHTSSGEPIFTNLLSLVGVTDGAAAQVHSCVGGILRIDFGTESAGWLELLSDDIPAEVAATITVAISETNVRMPGKALRPVPHPGGVYRLETNHALYEGVRFGFVRIPNTCNNQNKSESLTSPASSLWHIRAIRVIAQSLRVPYRGHFVAESGNHGGRPLNANSTLLSRIWWTGAYCPKLNMGTEQLGPGALPPSKFMLNAVLVDRGDRYGWTGDGMHMLHIPCEADRNSSNCLMTCVGVCSDHVAQAAILTAFGQHEFVRQSLWNTHNDSDSLPAYALWWVLSVTEYYTASGDADTLKLYAENIDAKLRAAVSTEGSSMLWGHAGNQQAWADRRPHVCFLGWDERLGAGFEFADESNEVARMYSMLTARACVAFAKALMQLPKANSSSELVAMAISHQANADRIFSRLRATGPRWWEILRFGLHSAAEAAATTLTTPDENSAMYNDIVEFHQARSICSLAPFNSYFILIGLGRMGKLDAAREMIELCWGGMIELGATTFYEVYSIDWNSQIAKNGPVPGYMNGRTSLCHPYSSGVTTWMTQHLVGLRPLTPGWKTFIVQPTLFGPYSGSAATPMGCAMISGQPIASGGWRHVLTVPPSTSARVVIPIFRSKAFDEDPSNDIHGSLHVALNGTRTNGYTLASARSGGSELLPDGAIDWDGMFKLVFANLLPPGHHIIDIQLDLAVETNFSKGKGRPYSLQSHYPAKVHLIDRTTRGDWQGSGMHKKYGNDGIVLFAPLDSSIDLGTLPHYVANISTFDPDKLQSQRGSYAPSRHDFQSNASAAKAAMQLINSSLSALRLDGECTACSGHRGLGSIVDFSLSNPNNAFVDINMVGGHGGSTSTTISIYMCDWHLGRQNPKNIFPHLNRTVGVVVYALPSKEKFVPLTVVDNFSSGVWITFAMASSHNTNGDEMNGTTLLSWPSLRLRFTGIVGDGVTLSAIAFDTHKATLS
eukprot:SAG31_NODE_369_length_16731_cov_36.453283_2_plen_1168_part_00